MQAPSQNGKIEAKGFVLRDENGKQRGEFGMEGEVPSFRMFDSNEQEQVSLAIVKGCPMLTLSGYNGIVILSFVEGAPSLFLSDPNGRSVINLSVKPDHATLNLSHSGKPAVGLNVSDDGPEIDLFDSEGNGDVKANIHLLAGAPHLDLYGFDGKSFASLSVQENAPALTLCESENMAVTKLTSGKDGSSLFLKGAT